MANRVAPEVRSANMRAVKSKDTGPEMRVRRVAHALGLRYRLHNRRLPGSPDLTLPKHKAVIFVHGCFWHRHAGCPKSQTPKTRTDFWEAKFSRNVERDRAYECKLEELGWRVVVIWECQTNDDEKIANLLRLNFDLPQFDNTGVDRCPRLPGRIRKAIS